jgi:hypothetical protein
LWIEPIIIKLQQSRFITRSWIITAGKLLQDSLLNQPLITKLDSRQFTLADQASNRFRVNVQPDQALSDGDQALDIPSFAVLMNELRRVCSLYQRHLPRSLDA